MATRFHTASVAVREAIQKSYLISSPANIRPERYRLRTTRSNLNEEGSVRKWTFGKRDINMQNKILLMVGETGTGKTTLINAMVNYILGVKFTDEVWFEITEEGGDNDMSDQSRIQTSEVTVYEVFVQENPICLTIIDTPGYGDTRGTDLDKKIAENLYKLFHSDTGVKEIDAVCLVVKASVNRLSDTQKYIYDAVLSLFAKDIKDNIVVLFTYSDGTPPEDAINAIKKAGIPCRKDEENEPGHFLFNNHQTEKKNTKYIKAFQAAWELTEDSFSDFFDSLKEQNRKSLQKTKSVLSESKLLEICISNLQHGIDFVESKKNELVQIHKSLQVNQEKIKINENFTFKVKEYNKEKILIQNASWCNRKATTCSVCKENCHEYGCWLSPSVEWCEVMKNGRCTSCTGKCHYTKHVRENKKYIRCSRKIMLTFDDLKDQYECSSNSESDLKFNSEVFDNVKKDFESNKKQEKEMKSIETSLENELLKNEKEKFELVEEACRAFTRLYEIALKPDSSFIVQSLDFFIPRVEEIKKPDLVNKLRELREIQPESQERVHAAFVYAGARK